MAALDDGADAIVIELNTPGGEVGVMRDIVGQGIPASGNMMTVALGIFVITYFLGRFGQEAVAAGVSAALRATDTVSSNHRGHGHALADRLALHLRSPAPDAPLMDGGVSSTVEGLLSPYVRAAAGGGKGTDFSVPAQRNGGDEPPAWDDDIPF